MKLKITFRRNLRLFEVIPRYYGVAYYDHRIAQGIAYPIPINLLVRGYRKLLQWVRVYTPSQRDRELAEATGQGFQQGLVAGDAIATERIHRQFDYELAKYQQETKNNA